MSFDVRKDFPVLSRQVHGKPLVYLDSAATALKPQSVLDAMSEHDSLRTANVHRGVHLLSEEATRAYEGVREKAQAFINASSEREIVFTSGATAGINTVAYSFDGFLRPGDEVLITEMEHHSNIVPWQMLCERTGAKLRYIGLTDSGELDLSNIGELLNEKTRLLAFVYISNSLGTITRVRDLIDRAHAHDVPVLIDAAQAVPHMKVNVQELDCEFLVFSSHKMYGPTGVGVLYGKEVWLEKLPPFLGGGDMIRTVTMEGSTYAGLPTKFEAGTPNITGVVGMGAAIDYLSGLGIDKVAKAESELLKYGTAQLGEIPGLTLVGKAEDKAAVLGFTLDGVHPHDLGSIVDGHGVAIRTGHHCCQPVMDYFGVPATARASLGVYNSKEDIDALAKAIYHAKEIFG